MVTHDEVAARPARYGTLVFLLVLPVVAGIQYAFEGSVAPARAVLLAVVFTATYVGMALYARRLQ